MPMPTPNDSDDPNPFAALEEAGPILGFVHHHFGEADLRELLTRVAAERNTTREFLESAAAELEEAGLIQPAQITREFAAECESEFELRNPYQENSFNWRVWRANWLRKRRQATKELKPSPKGRKPRNPRKP